ncbi:fatty acid hydroxylase family protein [Siminovitchia acidinfaciens]|uniref:Fatty acid hydroxylase family protein n=1 Tax=Siminovitchia acidinfaciens TaxID=2321395 RepID=A0A429Y045_9BACI|nr:sterol desaturase family protein [Siminovitchia acidinfaciens]RST74393.1 fatty acid hydroxylase family protein [Siminovitchia acidinfaciens]
MKKKGLYRDFFLFFDITVMLLTLAILSILVIVNGDTWILTIYFLVGLVAYMFTEYATHRFLFHLKTPKNPLFLKFLKRLHYDHHKDPDDLKLLFLPLWYTIPNFIIVALIFYTIESTIVGTSAFLMGIIVMLLVYEWKHYVAHRPIKPITRFGKWVKKLHLLHHFKNENYWYGVSTPFVDALFGTLKDEKKVEKSKTATDLEKRGIS